LIEQWIETQGAKMSQLTPEQVDFKRKMWEVRHSLSQPSDFPDGPHLAIIDFGTIHIPGDERSKQHPGHGYPAHNETTISYRWWKPEDREFWEAEIAERETSYKKGTYVALENGHKVTVEPKFSIKVS
jgi:hypothetical protein